MWQKLLTVVMQPLSLKHVSIKEMNLNNSAAPIQ